MEAYEIAHFDQTLEKIAQESHSAQADLNQLEPQVAELFKQVNRTEDVNTLNEYYLKSLLLSRAQMICRALALAKDQPYFTRVDFIAEGQRDQETFYIGKYGVSDSQTLEPVVVDWRAPIANLYYSGQIGPTHYVTPDGRVDGELTRKRQFQVQDGKLLSYYDADVVSQDKLLGQVLSQVSQGKLKEVVTTIQAEQNAVIRHPLSRSLIVQGVAGSGKTTIALHRIAYLLYTHQKTLLPGALMILAPNPLFLDYISQVLPDLGVADVHQLTFAGLCAILLGKDMPRLKPDQRLTKVVSGAPDKADILYHAQKRASARYLDQIDDFMDGIEQQLCPQGDILYGPVVVYTKQELTDMLLSDLKPLPLNARIRAVVRNAKTRVKEAVKRVQALLEEDCARRADRLRQSMPDSPQRRARMQTLYQSRDQRLKEAADQAGPFLKQFTASLGGFKTAALYAQFSGQAKPALDADDLPALVWIKRRVDGLEGKLSLMHIIVDEAQDMTGAQLRLLDELFRHPTFTLVGDMGQSIHDYNGVRDWTQAQNAIGGADERFLVTSYRSTVEIMSAANAVAARHPYAGQVAAKPVLRHGDAPEFAAASNDRERIALLRAQINHCRDTLGYHSICVIESDVQCPATARALGIPVLDASSDNYQSGVFCAPVSQVKGLEFDAVLLANVNADAYPDDPGHCKLLYVAMTRPLHRLWGVYTGARTALLEA